MGSFDVKIAKFMEIFIEQQGYTRVVEGLQNTLLIAVTGLILGILIGTLIAQFVCFQNTNFYHVF